VLGVMLLAWLRVILETSESVDAHSLKRSDLRVNWVEACSVQLDTGDRFLVRGFNASPTGIGFISRYRFSPYQRLTLLPTEGDGEPVRVRVVHCTQTLQGHKIGCVLEQV